MSVTHGKPCVHMHGTWNVYKIGWRSVCGRGEEQKGKERKRKGKGRKGREERKEREKEKKGREKEGKRKSVFRWSKLTEPESKVRIFDEDYAPIGRDSSYFGLFSTIRAVGLCFFPKGLFGQISKYGNATLFLSSTLAGFPGGKNEGLQTRVLHVNCSNISELDVGF